MASIQLSPSSSLTSSAVRRTSSPLRPPLRLSFCRSLPSGFTISSTHKNVGRVRFSSVVSQAQQTAADFPAVSDATWESTVLKADGPVLVEFWAPWCGPCRMIHPVIAELSAEYAGKIKFFKLNTDESPSIATKYGIRSVPTIMIFLDGKKKDAVIGAVPKTTLTATIEKFCRQG